MTVPLSTKALAAASVAVFLCACSPQDSADASAKPQTGSTAGSGFVDEQWYLPVRPEAWNDIINRTLYVRTLGAGEPVIVLHGGWGAEHSYLLDLVEPLKNEFQFILYDQRGSLRSRCGECEISVSQHVADIERLRKELGLEKVSILGHSMGTYLAMRYLQEHPQRVDDLVLMAALYPSSDKPALEGASELKYKTMEEFAERPEVQKILEEEDLDGDWTKLTGRAITDRWKVEFAKLYIVNVDRWRDVEGGAAFYSPEASAAAVETMPETHDFRPALENHDKSIQIINGRYDYLDFGARQWTSLAAQEGSNVSLTVIEDAGHNSWIDKPEEVAGAVRAALSR